jgi:hypothetical protein
MSTNLYGDTSAYTSGSTYAQMITAFFTASRAISSCSNICVPCIGQNFTTSQQWSDAGQLCGGTAYQGGCNQIIGGCAGGVATLGLQTSLAANLQASNLNVGWGGTGPEMQTHILALSLPPAAQAIQTNNDFVLNQGNNKGVDVWGMTPGNYGLNPDFRYLSELPI